jgi:hypothetical protein
VGSGIRPLRDFRHIGSGAAWNSRNLYWIGNPVRTMQQHPRRIGSCAACRRDNSSMYALRCKIQISIINLSGQLEEESSIMVFGSTAYQPELVSGSVVQCRRVKMARLVAELSSGAGSPVHHYCKPLQSLLGNWTKLLSSRQVKQETPAVIYRGNLPASRLAAGHWRARGDRCLPCSSCDMRRCVGRRWIRA